MWMRAPFMPVERCPSTAMGTRLISRSAGGKADTGKRGEVGEQARVGGVSLGQRRLGRGGRRPRTNVFAALRVRVSGALALARRRRDGARRSTAPAGLPRAHAGRAVPGGLVGLAAPRPRMAFA